MSFQAFALKIKEFDYTHGIMTLPQESIWYRAYAPNRPLLTNNPLFFGDIEVAFINTQQGNRHLGEFKCTRPLRVLDIRYVMSILPFVFCKDSPDTEMMKKITISLGLCSMEKQMQLLRELSADEYPNLPDSIRRMEAFVGLDTKPNWTNPIELRGVRIGITDIDYQVMMWLKHLFSHVADGIIAPALPTPFHDQMFQEVDKSVMYEELILFEPNGVLQFVQDRPITDKLIYYVPTGEFQQFLQAHDKIVFDAKPIRYSRTAAQRGGKPYVPLVKDEMGEKMAVDAKFRREVDGIQKHWTKDIKRIQRSQQFLQHVFLPIKMSY